MKKDFISEHLIKKIREIVKYKRNILKADNNWLYFDEPIKPAKSSKLFKEINRINIYNVYPKEGLLPVSWMHISGKEIIKIYEMVKENKFYTYKSIDGKSHKVRIKKRK